MKKCVNMNITIYWIVIVLQRSCSSKIQPVLFDTSPSHSLAVVLHAFKVAMEKMAFMNTFGPVLINSRYIDYMTIAE